MAFITHSLQFKVSEVHDFVVNADVQVSALAADALGSVSPADSCLQLFTDK